MSTSRAHVAPTQGGRASAGAFGRTMLIGLIAFLTVIDLFGTQAILPALAEAYRVSPAAMGLAVNASTLGMAAAGLAVALFGRRVDRRRGILASLAALAIPTALLAFAPDLSAFAALRIAQGLCMASAFTLTLAYLGERCSAEDAAGAFSAYIAGNVASNLFGRLFAAGVADHLGIGPAFGALAVLNLSGALLASVGLTGVTRPDPSESDPPIRAAWRLHLADPRLRAGFAIGFCILFAFIGTFTYVNFVLVGQPIGLGQMALGSVYFVFLPSIATTLMAGRVAASVGVRPALGIGLAAAAAGLPLLVLPSLPAVLAGLMLVGCGTFFAQAVVTGFVSRNATVDRLSASGLYLACYFLGGLVGSAVLGQVFDRYGWPACVAGIAVVLAVAGVLASRLRTSSAPRPTPVQQRG
jgi:MFS transporter, YNFM family, putative membrane transport protein